MHWSVLEQIWVRLYIPHVWKNMDAALVLSFPRANPSRDTTRGLPRVRVLNWLRISSLAVVASSWRVENSLFLLGLNAFSIRYKYKLLRLYYKFYLSCVRISSGTSSKDATFSLCFSVAASTDGEPRPWNEFTSVAALVEPIVAGWSQRRAAGK